MDPEIVQKLREKPDQVLPHVDYSNVCSFVNGFFYESGKLSAFREWLSLKLEKRTPFWWPGIVLQLEFGIDHSANVQGDDERQRAIHSLLDLLVEYLSAADSKEARKRIKDEYQQKLGRNET
jgi:hypothetical protein